MSDRDHGVRSCSLSDTKIRHFRVTAKFPDRFFNICSTPPRGSPRMRSRSARRDLSVRRTHPSRRQACPHRIPARPARFLRRDRSLARFSYSDARTTRRRKNRRPIRSRIRIPASPAPPRMLRSGTTELRLLLRPTFHIFACRYGNNTSLIPLLLSTPRCRSGHGHRQRRRLRPPHQQTATPSLGPSGVARMIYVSLVEPLGCGPKPRSPPVVQPVRTAGDRCRGPSRAVSCSSASSTAPCRRSVEPARGPASGVRWTASRRTRA